MHLAHRFQSEGCDEKAFTFHVETYRSFLLVVKTQAHGDSN